MIDLSTLELRHLGHGDIVQFFKDRSSVDVGSVYARVDELESLQLATLFTASPKLLAALKNLLGQVEMFCSKFDEADFETAQALAAINEAEGKLPGTGLQTQPTALETSKSIAAKLRAMAANYPANHLWDKLDAKTCLEGALLLEGRHPKVKPAAPIFDLVGHLHRQIAFSARTFGPGERTAGVVDHITKELYEVLDGGELEEWVDVIILALDGAWRCGHTPEQITAAIVAKQTKNEGRTLPDWRTAEPGKAIEHIRDDAAKATA